MIETGIALKLRMAADSLHITPRPTADVIALLREAADEADRFNGGMLAWKKTAETKDAKLSEEMTDRINERVAARLAAAPVAAQEPVAWFEKSKTGGLWFLAYSFNPDAETQPLYTAPGVAPALPVLPAQVERPCLVGDSAAAMYPTDTIWPTAHAVEAVLHAQQALHERMANAVSHAIEGAVSSQPAQGSPDEPCDNCGLGHPSSNCIYKPAQDETDAKYQVIVDRRDLFDKIRAAWREGQSVGQQPQCESWSDATRYAEHVITEWRTMQPAPPETWKVLPSQPAPDTAAIRAAALEEAAKAVTDRAVSDEIFVENAVDAIRALIGGSK